MAFFDWIIIVYLFRNASRKTEYKQRQPETTAPHLQLRAAHSTLVGPQNDPTSETAIYTARLRDKLLTPTIRLEVRYYIRSQH